MTGPAALVLTRCSEPFPAWSAPRRRTVAAGIVLAVGAALLPARPAAAAPLCALDSATKRLTVSNRGTGIELWDTSGFLIVNHESCGALEDLNRVLIDMEDQADLLFFDLAEGHLGPGTPLEAGGTREVEFDVTGVGSAEVEVSGPAPPTTSRWASGRTRTASSAN